MDEILSSLKGKNKVKILFVCLGNICRSPAAEVIMRHVVSEHDDKGFYLDSAGTGRYHIGELPDQRMRIHARRRGYDLNHRCRQVTESDFDDFDLIIGMDDQNITNLKRLAPTYEASKKIVNMAIFADPSFRYDYIPDPYYEGSEGFELVLDLLESACSNLYTRIKYLVQENRASQ